MGPLERENASIFAASLIKSNRDVEVIYFASNARYVTLDRDLPLMELMQSIKRNFGNGATNFNAIFQLANKPYDTIVILSDNEGWVKADKLPAARQGYVERFSINPIIYSFDLGGDGSLMFHEDSIITLAGGSFLVFRMLGYLNMHRTKLVDMFDQVVIGKPLPRFDNTADEE
jgi:hypothetical protein